MFDFSDLQAFVQQHREWAGLIFAVLAFGESLIFIGLFIPATAFMLGTGLLLQKGVLDPWTVIIWSIVGASLGDAVTYWLGRWVGPSAARHWPLNRDPSAVAKARLFFRKYGFLSIFIGRFLGPVRSTIPLVAGMARMHHVTFQIANVLSACAWVPALLLPGHILGTRIKDINEISMAEGITVIAFVLFLTALGSWLGYKLQQRKNKERRQQRTRGPAEKAPKNGEMAGEV